MKYLIKEHHFKITESELIEDLQNTAKFLGKQNITYKEYCFAGNYAPQTITSRFGTWNNALQKAGLKILIRRKYTKDELLINLKNVWDKLGRQPHSNELIKPLSDHNPVVYRNLFGSWNKALRAFHKYAGKKNAVYKTKHKNLRSLKKRMRRALDKPITDLMRFEIFKRDNYKCKICGRSPAINPKVILHVDHIIPVAKGGRTEPANLQTLCDRCNLGKSDRSMYK